jgi:nuclear transport factor 2 (NTF2) superfamily protein
MKYSNLRYHYTDIDAVINILSEKRIRLTSCKSLNDHTEGEYLLQKFENDLNEYKEIYNALVSNFFVASFCMCDDNKHLWDNYGNVNIGFDFEGMEYDFHFVSDECGTVNATSGVIFGICVYTSEEDETYKKVLHYAKNKLTDIDFSDIPSQQYAYLSCFPCFFLKPQEYEAENECRIVSHLWNKEPFIFKANKKDVKYVEYHFNTDKVKSITIGPSPQKEVDRNKVEEFLKNSQEYKHIDILESSCDI